MDISVQFTDWLYETYNVTDVPTHFFIRLASIYKGEYKGLKEPVDPLTLWDAWERKLPQLKQFHTTLFFQQKKLDNIGTLFYDLGIIMNQWDSYLAWQEKHQSDVYFAKEEKRDRAKAIDYSKLGYNKLKSNQDEIDLDKTVAEIWGDDDG